MNISTTKQELVSYCGLYCGNCKKFKKGKCQGCQSNSSATWCKVRTCNIDNKYKSCADCIYPGINDCKKFNNPLAKLFGLVFNSDRAASIQMIKNEDYTTFVNQMIETGKMSVPRRRK